MKDLIEFVKVSKSFGKNKVLCNVSFGIKEGEIFALLGSSGSGKSTLLKILLGVVAPDSGEILFNGRKIQKPSELSTIVGLTTQENAFYERLTVQENMLYYANLYDIQKPKERIKFLLSSMRLSDAADSLAGRISGGMKRRLDFAISMLHDPALLVLDEPTTGLDPLLVEEFWKFVLSNKGNRTVILITHHFEEVDKYCDRAGILSKGRVAVKNIHANKKIFEEFRKEA